VPFTNIDKVKQHLSESGVGQDTFQDVAVHLVGVAPASLGAAHVRAGSLVVKSKEIGKPQQRAVSFSSDQISLTDQNLIPDSVVVASDTSLGKIYTENLDYGVDYPTGMLQRLATGAIANGASVSVWYYRYDLHKEGEDYSVNLSLGTIRRIAGGAIEDGQVVFVDFQTEGGVFAESQIAQAIGEADARVLQLIDSKYHNSMDQTLVSAETYLAVAVLCRMKAINSLSPANATGDNAPNWLALAQQYESEGLELLVRYNPARPTLSAPKAITGGGAE
jgi:hypothetical protein